MLENLTIFIFGVVVGQASLAVALAMCRSAKKGDNKNV